MNRNVFITGVSGFVGRNTARHFINKGFKVQGISRTDPHIDGLQWSYGDITDADSLPSFIKGDIIHCAALLTDGFSDAHYRVNVLGTSNVANITSTGKLVHISSSSVYNLAHASRNVSEVEFFPPNSTYYNSYGRTKAEAEEVIFKSKRNKPSIILRPHGIYGTDDTTLLPKLKNRIHHNVLLLPDGGKAYHSLTHIDNLIHGIEISLNANIEKTEAFNVADRSPIQLKEAISRLTAGNFVTPYIPVPLTLFASKVLKNVSEYEIRQVGFNRTYDISKAKTVLGYNPTPFVSW